METDTQQQIADAKTLDRLIGDTISNPQSPMARLKLGDEYLLRGDFDLAATQYQHAIGLDKTCVDAYDSYFDAMGNLIALKLQEKDNLQTASASRISIDAFQKQIILTVLTGEHAGIYSPGAAKMVQEYFKAGNEGMPDIQRA